VPSEAATMVWACTHFSKEWVWTGGEAREPIPVKEREFMLLAPAARTLQKMSEECVSTGFLKSACPVGSF